MNGPMALMLLATVSMASIPNARAADPVVRAPAAEAATSGKTTIGIEFGPEYFALDSDSHQAGDWSDNTLKLSVSHAFDKGWLLGGYFQTTFKPSDQYQYYGEGSLGYRFRFERFSLTPSVALGYTWDSTGITMDGQKNSDALYYALYLAGDLKLSESWTWNVFNLRYRNAFDTTWETPKAATGLTFAMDPANSVYVNFGYSWKDSGEGLKGDKINAAFGFKHAL
ncbi:MAG: hypothetical protein P0Y66_10240 [Candidatus Kaistia colombiensis]|nr:MAG: hypothetical protein P0Y66_10240 [Kaistia sp.]